MPGPVTQLFVLRGQVDEPELLQVARDTFAAFQANHTCKVTLDCAEVTSFTGKALLLLGWFCNQTRSAGLALRLLDLSDEIVRTVPDRLVESMIPADLRPQVMDAMPPRAVRSGARRAFSFSNN
ncbi:hypothetical protein R5W24_000123 [Gemmata sp. JC717]|uniref:hypothetical protein n=1 Tax=Gemmata algarum TaxID=2975278 RepID=UPI0021BB1E09|nr:hypothetical protein [Gemmata algarum]MDY3551050.1 hypothetical protein [Gemmata algarum]